MTRIGRHRATIDFSNDTWRAMVAVIDKMPMKVKFQEFVETAVKEKIAQAERKRKRK